MKSYLVFLILFMSATSVYSQTSVREEWLALHVRGGIGYLSHTASLQNFEGIVDCGTFTRGTTLAPNFSVAIERPVSPSVLASLAVRTSSRSTRLLANQTSLPAFDVTLRSQLPVLFESSIVATLPYIDILPEVVYSAYQGEKQRLRFLAGLVVGIPLSATFEMQQRIVSPSNAVYVQNKQQSISLSQGTRDILSISKPILGASLGIENMVPVGASNFFTQSVRLEYLVTNIISTGQWSAVGVRADIGFRFGFTQTSSMPQVEAPKVVPPPPPPVVKVTPFAAPTPLPILSTSIRALDVRLQTGNELRASLPLVNAIFFAQNSSAIADDYVKTAQSVLRTDDAVRHHKNILVSLADIIKSNPKATIIVEGATSGNDEPGGLSLAKERAENVMKALEALGVSRERMSARTFLVPRIASNADYAQGREENRRVDIIVKDAPLQEYISRQQFASLRGRMEFSVDAQHFNAGEIRVRSSVFDEQTLMRSETRTVSIDKRIPLNDSRIPVFIEASATSLQARADTTLEMNALKREMVVLDLSSFEAWLRFDYNSSTLSDANKDLLRQLLQSLPPGATISLLGSADALGDEESNLELSSKRASVTESFLKSIAGDRFRLESSISKDKVDESVPEGRFLNRSIRIRVRE